MQFTILFAALAATLSSVSALPVAELDIRDVYVPPVLYPNTETVWKAGSRHNVTWDVSSPPKQITNKTGMIYLRKDGRTIMSQPLATGFDILLGRKEITVPEDAQGKYVIVLFGDSGNWSGEFEITK